MRIKQIAHNYIEVTVTEGDLMLFDMNMETLSPNSPGMKTFLFRIMEFVKSETGFNPKKGQVFIEANRNGDKLVFKIKKMSLTNEDKKKKYKNARAVIKPTPEKVYIYGFESFDDMADALRHTDREMLLSCSVYRFMEAYYCAFRTDKPFDKHASVMNEFCSAHDEYEFTEAILDEHGERIASGESVVSLVDGLQRYNL